MSRVRVACFPFAGAGASLYRRCRDPAARALDLCPIQLPGREERFGEPLPGTLAELAAACTDDLLSRVRSADAYAVLGHSFGAIVAYEVVQRIVLVGARPPERLIVSGAASPWLPPRHRVASLTDDELLARIRENGGYDDALRHPGLRALLLPTLRADMTLGERYRPTSAEPLGILITALRGRDDHMVSRSGAERWRDVTKGEFAFEELPGGHMHLLEHVGAYWAAVGRAIGGISPEGQG
jgi:surfactin synthase thioesterase subunit